MKIEMKKKNNFVDGIILEVEDHKITLLTINMNSSIIRNIFIDDIINEKIDIWKYNDIIRSALIRGKRRRRY